MKFNLPHFRKHLPAILLGLAGVLALSLLFFRDFSGFYFDYEGVLSDSTNYVFSKKFNFLSLPQIADWQVGELLYPYGISMTFSCWILEIHFFGWLFGHFFDIGPWGQCYYVLSLLITFFGVYGIVSRYKGCFWGGAFAFLLTFCNYAAIGKFPEHFVHCIVHWVILSMLTDVVMVEKYWAGEKFSARFVQVKLLLLLLSLGSEMGYLAGTAYCSCFVAICAVLIAQFVRNRSFTKTLSWIRGQCGNIVTSYPKSIWNIVLSLCILTVAWLYLPTILQILRHAPPQTGAEVWKTGALRIFLPLFPGLYPAMQNIGVFRFTDTIFAWSSGWAILLLCFTGMSMHFRSDWKKWLPFLLLLLAMMTLDICPILRCFPTFRYIRIPERFSPFVTFLLLTPLYFACSAVTWPQVRAFVRRHRFPIFGLLLLLGVEMFTVYNKMRPQNARTPLVAFKQDYRNAVTRVRELPGEALFFFPFSAYGGDGQGMLNTSFGMTAHQMQFAALCRKKMNAVYFGRMQTEELDELRQFNWESYQIDKPFSEFQWRHLREYFQSTNYSAWILQRNDVSKQLLRDIHRRLGKPVCVFRIFKMEYEVIALPPSWRGDKVDRPRLAKLSKAPNIFDWRHEIDFGDVHGYRVVNGFVRDPERLFSNRRSASLMLGIPEELRNRNIFVKLQTSAFLTGALTAQSLKISIGDQTLAAIDYSSADKVDTIFEIPAEYTRDTGCRLDFSTRDIHSPKDLGMNQDYRPRGIHLYKLRMAASPAELEVPAKTPSVQSAPAPRRTANP